MPADQPFEVAVRIDPLDIDQVFVGQPATLVFPAFGRQTAPDIAGRIIRVSADAAADATTGLPYYEAIVAPDAAGLRALGEDALISGMPVETYLATGARTPLTYFTDPLAGYFRRAFREG
ncbi:MAG: type 1 secretion system HlyD family membrane fusion component [Rhodobacteraceae bacterium HLUCCO18]|nr:MAG: type 1 secretion system HlyD family membrane fusion component [Rhodobacteraceae bacterium HLUCCO18]